MSIAAFGGIILLVVGTYLHPMHADPNVPVAAFAEYANDPHWIASHLTQLFGVWLMSAVLVMLSGRMAGGPADMASRVGMAGAIASVAMAGALQAVDGIALKAMVDIWAAAPEEQRAALFPAVLAVRQIEVGLASIASLLFGLTVSVYGIALLSERSFPKWLGWLGLAGGILIAIAGVIIAYTGFSPLAMLVNMPASALLLFWIAVLGIFMWRTPSPVALSGNLNVRQES